MSLADVVNVVISLTAPPVTAAGFGVPLIPSPNASWVERTRDYSDISAVADDWDPTDPEYQAANAIFSQNPSPPLIEIGRLANKPTMVQTLALLGGAQAATYGVNVQKDAVVQKATFTPGVIAAWQNTHGYLAGDLVQNDTAPIKVYKCITPGTSAGSGGPTGTGSNITDGGAHWKYQGALVNGTANDVVIDGLVAAINALATPALNFTAAATGVAGAEILTATGNAVGDWFSLEPLAANSPAALSDLLTLTETTADAGIVADLTAIKDADSDWYGLILLFKGATVAAAAGWVESNTKLFIAGVADGKVATDADGGATDVAHALKAASRARTGVFFHPRSYEFADAAEMGRFFPISPGGDNWKMKSLSGVTPTTYTDTQKTNLNAKFCNFYYPLTNSTFVIGGKGKVAANEYIDVVRGLDWWSARVSERMVDVELQNEKVAFTDAGIALFEAELKGQNADGITAGLIAPFPIPIVTAVAAADVSATDRANRTYSGLATSFRLAGAINDLTVKASVTQ